MGAFIDLEGSTFGRLKVLGRADNRGKHVQWECRCICGSTVVVSATHLNSGHTQSCGCFRLDRTKKCNTTHGHTAGGKATKSYMRWVAMIKRCTNPKDKDFYAYGGRGITVCDRWATFENFHSDMGECPVGMSIDRVDVNKGYSPDNCVWADKYTQAVNKNRKGKLIGVKKSQSGRWKAFIGWRNKNYHLGTFDTLEEASAWRDAYIIANGWPHRLNCAEAANG